MPEHLGTDGIELANAREIPGGGIRDFGKLRAPAGDFPAHGQRLHIPITCKAAYTAGNRDDGRGRRGQAGR